jgi:uncharacterized protein (TIGR02646 family)
MVCVRSPNGQIGSASEVKRVLKGAAPLEYRAWLLTVRATNKEDYREMPREVKSVVLEALVDEQGQLCAYTMRRIDANMSHIEHVKPESLCRLDARGSDLDFANMLACFPREGMPRFCRYGAQKKEDWWNAALFVSPLSPTCERMFRFKRDGTVSALPASAAARNTIRILALDHPTLTEDRRRAIDEYLYGQSHNAPLSRAQASRLRERVCAISNGRFIEFCVALRDALGEHVEYMDKLARRKAFYKNKKGKR